MSAVAIIDSAGANLASLQFALERLQARSFLAHSARELARASHVILPGVGAAASAMRRLREAALVEPLRTLAQPVLGICLGMQLLFEHSEEGETEGLGVLPGRVRRLQVAPELPVPHMGWNQLTLLRSDPLLEGCASGDFVYYTHSYAAPQGARTLATTHYGGAFSAAVRQGNYWGVQFHPERSAHGGARILANFLRIQSCG